MTTHKRTDQCDKQKHYCHFCEHNNEPEALLQCTECFCLGGDRCGFEKKGEKSNDNR